MWLSQAVPLNISKIITLRLIENYKQIWKESIFDSPKCLNYRILKQDIQFEAYFNVLPSDIALPFFHFRSLNHKMSIEWERYL